MQAKLVNHLKLHFLIYVIFILFFTLRLQFQSPWLEDWDSVQFSLGLHEYSIVKHQPHPPGYPIFILIGRLIYPIFNSDLKTLTFMSVFFGTLSVLPLYFLVRKMFDQKTAVISAILLMITPVHWILSETPVSNVTGLFFLLCFSYLLYFNKVNYNRWPLVGFIGGLILGVRFTDSPIVLGLLGLLALKNLRLKNIVLLGVSFLLGLLVWWIPLVIISGFAGFSDSYMAIANWFAGHESGITQNFGIKYYFKSKALNLLDHLMVSYTWSFLVAVILSIILIIKESAFWAKFHYLFLITWAISYGIILFTLYNLDLPQYTLPLSIPFVITIAHFLRKIMAVKSLRIIVPSVAAIVLGLVLKYDFEQILGHQNSVPPTIAPVFLVKEKFSPSDTVLITTFTYRQFQYYAPGFLNYYGVEKLPQKMDSKYVIIDYKNLRDDVAILKDYKIVDSFTFKEPNLYMPRIHKTNLYVLTK